MPLRIVRFLIPLIFSALPAASLAQSSVLNNGEWFKIGIVDRGVYRLDYGILKELGVPMETLDPATIQLFGNGGNGSLPQANDAVRPEDLQENAIFISDGGDDSFDPDDYLLFFGNTPDKLEFSGEKFVYEDHIYSDTLFYFLTYGQKVGERIQQSSSLNADVILDKVYTCTVHDRNDFNLLNSGRLWFGENFDKPGKRHTITLDIPEKARHAVIDVVAMGASFSTSSFEISVAGANVGTVEIPARPNAESTSRAFVGNETFFSKITGGDLKVDITYQSSDSKSYGFLDHIVASVETGLVYEGTPYFFSVKTAASNTRFTIDQYKPHLQLWDIQNVTHPKLVEVQPDGTFTVSSHTVRSFFLFELDHAMAPASIKALDNQNIRSLYGIEFLIITHPRFRGDAVRLAAYRNAVSGLNARVVTVDKIYNEFSSGVQDITAIRDFIRHQVTGGNLQYVLLFGDGSYDYKDRISSNTNFVPTYQSRNSLNTVFTYSSDDYYTFMEAGEGEWEESLSGNHTSDIAVGRLPVKNEEQAKVIVDKIIHYESAACKGPWQTRVLFAADDGDDNFHQQDADDLAESMDELNASISVEKLYLDAFPQRNQFSEAASRAFDREVHEGVLVVDYTGHGNELQLAVERLVADFDIVRWTNKDVLPFFVTATCEFGVFDNPDWYSSGERLLFHPDGGGIGLISATRVVYASSNFLVNQAFTEEVFLRRDNRYQTIGEIFMHMKNNSLFGRNNRNYTLLADPSMSLNYPALSINIDSLKDSSGNPVSDLQSFSEVTFYGSVRDHEQLVDFFQGEVEIVLYDHPHEHVTLGDQNDPFRYQARNSILFSGLASVVNGRFQVSMLLPEATADFTDDVKMVMYAKEEKGKLDASGGLNDLVFEPGGFVDDDHPPELKIFIGDTLFKNGDMVSPNAQLLVDIKDESGINLSFKKPSGVLRAHLNGEEIILNKYYKADRDTYRSGKVVYLFRNLPKGTYELTVFVSDIAGNPASQAVTFKVADKNEMAVNNFKAYPNPAAGDITFSFTHDRSGENLRISYRIINMMGTILHQESHRIANAPSIIDSLNWSLEEQELAGGIDAGIYVYDFTISSEKDGARKQVRGRLMLQ